MKFPALATILISSVAISACNFTQPPAQVVMKGSNFYGTQGANPVQVASVSTAASQHIMATPASKPTAPANQLASVQPRPSYGFQPTAASPARTRVELAQVTVTDLEPLTASTSAPMASSSGINVSEANGELPPLETADSAVANKPQMLPEPQARVVAETKTIPQTAPAPAVASSKGFIWPVKGKVISSFGQSKDGETNDGINIAAQQGEPIVAAADGEVVYSGNELRGYGNMVIVRHENGLMTAYAHADRILVSKGEHVRQGVTIATVGKSGGVDQAQVHFGVRKNKEPVDPMTVLSQNNYAAR
jgi:murein DD-endopeptidase MepM/ murein hydrolase activator NlpD